jgi:hypothetical protein
MISHDFPVNFDAVELRERNFLRKLGKYGIDKINSRFFFIIVNVTLRWTATDRSLGVKAWLTSPHSERPVISTNKITKNKESARKAQICKSCTQRETCVRIDKCSISFILH